MYFFLSFLVYGHDVSRTYLYTSDCQQFNDAYTSSVGSHNKLRLICFRVCSLLCECSARCSTCWCCTESVVSSAEAYTSSHQGQATHTESKHLPCKRKSHHRRQESTQVLVRICIATQMRTAKIALQAVAVHMQKPCYNYPLV